MNGSPDVVEPTRSELGGFDAKGSAGGLDANGSAAPGTGFSVPNVVSSKGRGGTVDLRRAAGTWEGVGATEPIGGGATGRAWAS
jgi:hypothetical protein